ncbi:MAG: hypothetical protein ABIP53_07225 [Candidatus Limnocylindrales bacterium]
MDGRELAMDEVAHDYLVLSLAVGEMEDGIVDAYYGPPELRDEAAARSNSPSALADEALALRRRVVSDVANTQRARWLDRQLVALETLCRRIGGEDMTYLDEVTRYFDAAPEATPPEAYKTLRRELDELLPAGESLRARLDARDEQLTIAREHVGDVIAWVTAELRVDCAAVFPIPEGESLELTLVTDKPWSAYNWYKGGLRSRIEFNIDLPTRAHQLVGTLGHEAFPGHHLEHAWKEQRLVREQGYAEATVQLINTPEAYISEGLAEVGPRLLVDSARWQELLLRIAERAGLPLTPADAEREWRISQAMGAHRGSGGDAALQLHVEGKSRDEVKRFLVEDGLLTPERAAKNLEFITHPLWRTYVFCYAGGDRLLSRWCASAGDIHAQRTRFFRLLTEELTPSGIADEIEQETPAA